MRAVAAFASFVAAIVAANWLTSTYGLVAVGFGLTATAGTYAAGLALGARDWVHETSGWLGALGAVIVGAGLSALLADPAIALASGVAFGLSELADLAVYTPLRERSKAAALAASNAVGAPIDTIAFLAIAGFPVTVAGVAGQLVGKAWMTLLALLALIAVRRWRR